MLAPLIGPVIDRAAGGRRTVIQLVAAARVVLALLMAVSIDALTLFPLVFAALVLQKTYLVSKQALVPSVVRTEAELVEANSKLGVIAGLTGFVAVIPAGSAPADAGQGLGDAGLLRAAVRLRPGEPPPGCPPTSSAATPEQPAERVQLHSAGLQLAAVAMLVLRASVGFMFFLLAFWLRTQTAGTAWFAVAVGLSALGTMAGNAISPRLRRAVREETMLAGALGAVGRRRHRGRAARRRRPPASGSPSPSTSPPPSAGWRSRASSSATPRRPTAAGPSPSSRPGSSSPGRSPG